MLRELEDADTARNRAADAGKPASLRGGHSRKHTARKRAIAAAAFIAAALVGAFAWQARAVKVAEGAVTTTAASAIADHLVIARH
jgi:hypothetical protein